MRDLSIVVLLVICALSAARAEMRTIVEGLPPVDWDQDTLSLPPEYFSEMPEQLRAWVEMREYRIPQVHDLLIEQFTEGFQKRERYNVISGDFDGMSVQDWAFVTFKDGKLKAFICWNADTAKIEKVDISGFSPEYGGFARCGLRSTRVLAFNIILAQCNREWLNSDISRNLRNNDGDTTNLPQVFNHDGLLFDGSGEGPINDFIRYYYKDHWIRFLHSEAKLQAIYDSVIVRNYFEK